MAQNGLHGLAGLALARWVTPRAPAEAAVPLALSITMGAMLPDVDLYPHSLGYLAHFVGGPALQIHRTATHSIWPILAAAGIGWALRRKSPKAGWGLLGLAMGLSAHVILDMAIWFASVDLFWPLSHLDGAAWKWPVPGAPPGPHAPVPVIDFWNVNPPAGEAGLRLPAVFGNPDFIANTLLSVDVLAFVLYITALRRIVGRDPSAKAETRRMKRWIVAGWAGFFILLGTAKPLPESYQNIVALTPVLLGFLPYAWTQTVRHRNALGAWARGEAAQ